MDYKQKQDEVRTKIAAHLGKTPEELVGQLHLVDLSGVLKYIAISYSHIRSATISAESVPAALSLFAMVVDILPWVYAVVAKDEAISLLRAANKAQDQQGIAEHSVALASARAEQLMYQITYSLEQAGVSAELIQELRTVARQS